MKQLQQYVHILVLCFTKSTESAHVIIEVVRFL